MALCFGQSADESEDEEVSNEIKITKYLTYYYFRKHFERKYGKTDAKPFPESIKLLCAEYAGSTMKETTFLAMLKVIGDKINSIVSDWHNQSQKNILTNVSQHIEIDSKTYKYKPQQRKEFVGLSKLYGIDWSVDSKYIATCSQAGVIIVWDVLTGFKKLAIKCDNGYCNAVTFCPKYNLIACGGLDNKVTIYKTKDENNEFIDVCNVKNHQFTDHQGYISRIQFVADGNDILSSSGDTTCILWDFDKKILKNTFQSHTDDILWCELNKYHPNLFATASSDKMVKIWDLRMTQYEIGTFRGHDGDVNVVRWFPDGYGLVTGSEDGCTKLFDMRCYREMSQYKDENMIEVTSVAISKSGSYIYSSYTNGNVYVWSTLNQTNSYLCKLGHPLRVSAIDISPDGYGLATACWDLKLRVFA